MLLCIYGGFVVQYEVFFDFDLQFFVVYGYVVVCCNLCGSLGYGYEFLKVFWVDWGNKDFQDVMVVVDYLIEFGYIDFDCFGVGGWLYGGIFINYVIMQMECFEVVIIGVSEVFYIVNYGYDYYQYYWEKEFGLFWESCENWECILFFNKVEKVIMLMFVMGGVFDWNVLILNFEQFYQVLCCCGIVIQFVVYLNEYYGIW